MNQMSTKLYVLIVFTVVIGVLSSFFSGYFLKSLLSPSKSGDASVVKRLEFKPNFIDEVIIVAKEKPYQTLILSAIRTYTSTDSYSYTVKAFYFDGTKWTKQISKGNTAQLDIMPKTTYLPKWEINSDPSYMLKQSALGEALLNDNKIEFDAPLLLNEMGVRSDPKYTKFMSETEGTLTINNAQYGSHVLYSRIYSFNAPESLVTTSDPSGIETEWLAFWDNEGNFYSIDETKIDNKKTLDIYKAHSMAILKDVDKKIQKSFTLNLVKNGLNKYKVDILENISSSISVTRLNSVNKAVDENDIWNTGQVVGEVKLKNGKIIKGFGIFEQISQ